MQAFLLALRSWSRVSALPRRPIAYKAIALLTELTRRVFGFGAPVCPMGRSGKPKTKFLVRLTRLELAQP